MNPLPSKMKRQNACVVVAITAVLVLVGCSRQPKPTPGALAENVLAMVGETAITTGALAAELNRAGSTDKQAGLDRLIRRELILAEVQRTGFAAQPETQEAWRNFIVNRFVESQRQRIDEIPTPTSAEVETYYQAHVDAYTKPERRQVALIHLRESGATPEARETLTTKANRLRAAAVAEAANTADFGLLAAQYSDHRASRTVGGDVGWIIASNPKGAWPAEVMAGMRALTQPGEISPVIFTGQGCYLLKLIARQPRELVPLEQVRERVTYELARARAQQAEAGFYSQLQANFPVQVNSQRLEELTVPTRSLANAKPPRLPSR